MGGGGWFRGKCIYRAGMKLDMENEIGYVLTACFCRDHPGNRYANCPLSILLSVIAVVTACLDYDPERNLDITTLAYIHAEPILTWFHNYSQRPCSRSPHLAFAR